MVRLEDLVHGAVIRGILPDRVVTLVNVKRYGSAVAEVTFKDAEGTLGSQMLYRDREPTLELVTAGRPWSFDADGELFRLASEAHRIRLAYLFDPLLAVHSSNVEPLPHQLTAVYEEMLPQHTLRFLLADDPGAGKTIMTGLLITELRARGDLQRCLIVCPGSLVEQWQDELDRRFHLPFTIITNDTITAARTGNPFDDAPLAICRLDKLSRDADLQEHVAAVDWDLIACDEAHKMSASFFGGEVNYTKRYRLGQKLSNISRHFLLLTATPHNGKEPDFQLFLALLDADRFEGKYRERVNHDDLSGLMRRLVKEQLLTFAGTPLFPERRAYAVPYKLSDAEAKLYEQVTTYVRSEFDRADTLANDGRKGTIGFALTTLQRRLASSPEAIFQSLRRRRERLEARLREEQLLKHGAEISLDLNTGLPTLTDEDLDDLEDAPDAEVEATEESLVDRASAAQTIAELEAEIATLQELEVLARHVRESRRDRKWEELSHLLHDETAMRDANGQRRKLVIFTEYRDTLHYLADRLRDLLGQPEAVVTIHGGLGRDERRTAQYAFTQDKDVSILVATDAAGEGINLQRANLMVNYDLPWNPNRLEQRFGRIHRIGQTEVCHLWNLVAMETREGEVFATLLKKVEEERKALGSGVFDILGKMTFNKKPLRDLLMEAVRYGDEPEVRARLTRVVDEALDRDHLRDLLEERSLVRDVLDMTKVRAIREDMERAEARRLQPHFIASFFLAAFRHLGGTVMEREAGRYEVSYVPAPLRGRQRLMGSRETVYPRYERITFTKERVSVPGKPLAEFVCPGHPLLDATTDLVLERYRDLLTQGAVLVDPTDTSDRIRVLCELEHSIEDGTMTAMGSRRVVSRQLQFVEVDGEQVARAAGYAPYLDYRPVTQDEWGLVAPLLDLPWVRGDIEERAVGYAVTELVRTHFEEVRAQRDEQVTRTLVAVKERLTAEALYWDHRAEELRIREEAGKAPSNNPYLNSDRAWQRATELAARLETRTAQLDKERQLAPLPPVVVGGALVVPAGLLARLGGAHDVPNMHARDTARVEKFAMDAVMAAERRLGYEPRDVSALKCGWDIECRVGETGRLRLIEVKGRVAGAKTVTVTKNEILHALNAPDSFVLALVTVDGEQAVARYVRTPFQREPDFGVTSVNYDLDDLLARATEPR